MKKLLIPAVIAVLTLTGCSAGRLQERGWLRAAAVENGRYAFSFFGDTEPVSLKAESLSEALHAAELRCGREIFTGYTELIVLRDCPAKGLLSEMLTDWRVSPDCIVVESISDPCRLLTDGSAELIEGSVKRAAEKGEVPESSILSVLSGLLSSKDSAEIPSVTSRGACGKTTIRGA